MIEVAQIRDIMQEIAQQMLVWKRHFDSRNVLQKLEELKPKIEDPNLWEKADARELIIEYNELKNEADELTKITNQIDGIQDLIEHDLDYDMLELAYDEATDLRQKMQVIYMNMLFNDPDDVSNCFITVHSGSGGQESEDWARMLWEMYLKYARNYYDVVILDENYTDDGNIKSATMKVSSGKRKYPYGWFKSEVGVHRLVRISPYDKKKQRHTSFASVAVTLEVSDKIDVEIDEKDIKIDTYRASGAGGQHVNKTDSAIRITHIPTGIVVQCQNDRSQHRNKEEAFKMLRSRIFERRTQEMRKEMEAKAGEKKEVTWGSQIRSYVQHPYQMVKDHRTDFEIPNFGKVVLEAEIEGFLVAYLKFII